MTDSNLTEEQKAYEEKHRKPTVKAATANARWWNSRFHAERVNEEMEIEAAIQRHPSNKKGT